MRTEEERGQGLGPGPRPPVLCSPSFSHSATFFHLRAATSAMLPFLPRSHVSTCYLSSALPRQQVLPFLLDPLLHATRSLALMTPPHSEKRQLSPLSWCMDRMLCPPRPVQSPLLAPPVSSFLCTVSQHQQLHAKHWRLPTSPPQYCILST